MARRRSLVIAVLLLLGLPAVATADVLVNAPKANEGCGKKIKVGVWYQSSSGGKKWAHIKIVNKNGTVVWHKNVKATGTWKYWYYKGKCGGHYTVKYTTAKGSATFSVHVHKASSGDGSGVGFY